MNSNPPPTQAAESRAGLPFLGIAFLWAAWVFFQYFFGKNHPLTQVLPFLGKIWDLSAFAPATYPRFWEIQGTSLYILLCGFLISGTTWSLGRRVRKWLTLDLPDPWIGFAFDFGFGICCLNLFWIGTGLEGLWVKPVWVTMEGLFFLLFVMDVVRCFKDFSLKTFSSLFPRDPFYLFLVIVGVFYCFFSVLQNLAPETFYDSMVYHLAVPQYWLLHHGLVDFPTNFFSNYPYGAEIYFLNGLVWQGTETAKMLHVVSFGVCALLAGGWAREMGGEKAGWLTLGFTLTLPLFTVNLWTTEVEGFLALAVVLFLYSLLRFAHGNGKPTLWACVAGLFLGLALSTKYTAFLAAGCAIPILAVQKFKLLRRDHWKFWGAMFLGALTLLSPWMLKNVVFTGNPFFPYLMDHFPGRHLTPFGYGQLLQEQHARVTTDAWSWLLLPWTLTLSDPDINNFCGPLSLSLVPLLFLFRLRHPALRFLAILTPLLLAAGFAVTHILRFILPDFAFFFVLAGVVLAGGNKPAWGKATAAVAVVSAILCFAYLAVISHYYYACAGIWSGRQTRVEYLAGPGKITSYASMAQWVSQNTAPDARLLIVGDARGLYYDRPFLSNTVFDEQILPKIVKEEKDTAGILRRLREYGVDYLAVNGLEGIRVSADYHHYDLTPEEWKRLDDFIQNGTEAVYQQNLQGVYRVLPEAQPARPAETLDLILFFSKPASQFVKNVQRHQWRDAEGNLNEISELYPFSKFWKEQKSKFEKSAGAALKS